MYVYNLYLLLCCVLLTEGLTESRLLRSRRGACEFGIYKHEGNTCCICQTGYRVLIHCTNNKETYCKRCEDGSYMDHPNSDDQCQGCKICSSDENMDTMVRCSAYSNTVCRCKENHYCDKGDLCKACYSCDTCEEHGVKQPCTETTNTVCHDPKGPAGIIAAVMMSLILVAGVVVFCLWRKQKFCFKNRQMNRWTSEEDFPLKDVDLNPHLSEIADLLGWKTMKRVAQRTGMSKTEVEEHELNHRNDVKEQTFALLKTWSQRQGLHGAYPALIKTLLHMKERRTADEIQNIVEKEVKAQP